MQVFEFLARVAVVFIHEQKARSRHKGFAALNWDCHIIGRVFFGLMSAPQKKEFACEPNRRC
ncbi:hypothetical protein [Bradyrhizobium sp. SZCCHNRI1003]|uniref:hypothetical protein n=1 Tax=Bradyrhizobium sp. SZCCHNRI1003 TaxID=3057275 RepID=UPI002915F3B2|nr:hypothetical protein [Bradyrhizobium sp. SZCCHNRI1003]